MSAEVTIQDDDLSFVPEFDINDPLVLIVVDDLYRNVFGYNRSEHYFIKEHYWYFEQIAKEYGATAGFVWAKPAELGWDDLAYMDKIEVCALKFESDDEKVFCYLKNK